VSEDRLEPFRRRVGFRFGSRFSGVALSRAIARRHARRDGWESVVDTLVHEMVHQWQHETGRPVAHDRAFRQKARAVGISPRAQRPPTPR